MKKVVVDSNILFRLYSAYKGTNINSIASYKALILLLNLAKEGKVKLYITPQIFNEFLNLKGKKQEAVDRFNNFIKEYITIINFSEADNLKILSLMKQLATKRVEVLNKYDNKIYSTLLFKQAENPGDRNYADLKIMTEAVMVNLPILTENMKDFSGYIHINKVLNPLGLNYSHEVMRLDTFYKEFFPAERKKLLEEISAWQVKMNNSGNTNTADNIDNNYTNYDNKKKHTYNQSKNNYYTNKNKKKLSSDHDQAMNF